MAETDIHRKLMTDLIEILGAHFEAVPNVYVSVNLLLYYTGESTQEIGRSRCICRLWG